MIWAYTDQATRKSVPVTAETRAIILAAEPGLAASGERRDEQRNPVRHGGPPARRGSGILDEAARERLEAFLATSPATSSTTTGGSNSRTSSGMRARSSSWGRWGSLRPRPSRHWRIRACGHRHPLHVHPRRIGDRLWQKPETQLPGGLLIAAAVAMTPLIVLRPAGGLEHLGPAGPTRRLSQLLQTGALGLRAMEIVTLLVATLALRRYSFAFLALPRPLPLVPVDGPCPAALWPRGRVRSQAGCLDGLRDRLDPCAHPLRAPAARHDAAFWLHLVAAITFWCGLTFRGSDSHLAKAAYCALNIGLIGFSVFVGRRVYAVFGVIGVMTYLETSPGMSSRIRSSSPTCSRSSALR